MLPTTNQGSELRSSSKPPWSRWFQTLLLTSLLFFPAPIQAVTNPQSGTPAVSATIPDNFIPSPPILISPNNHAVLNTSAPTFIFEPSSETTNLHKYEIWLNGEFNHQILHLNQLTLTTTAASALPDGSHTWKVKAVNNSGIGADSATFSFTIDTSPPIILINQIADQLVNISSQDSSSIPQEPITIQTNTPTISGSSEAQATLTFNLESSIASYTFTTTAGSDASFNLTPGFQLASATYTVSTSSSDQASNYTSLPTFTLTIAPQPAKTAFITIPLPKPLPSIKIPGLPIPQPPLHSLPQLLTAYPLTPASQTILSLLPWLIIFNLILYIIIKKRIIIFLNLVILIYLTLATFHFLPLIFICLHLILLYPLNHITTLLIALILQASQTTL